MTILILSIITFVLIMFAVKTSKEIKDIREQMRWLDRIEKVRLYVLTHYPSFHYFWMPTFKYMFENPDDFRVRGIVNYIEGEMNGMDIS